MALTACGECKREISTTARACPHCGAKLPGAFSWPIAAVGIFIVVAVAGSIAARMAPSDEERRLRRAEIEMCWQAQARKSLEPAAARAVARICEGKEAEFQRLYGVRP